MKKTRKTDSSKIPKIRIPDKAFWLYLQRQLFKSIGLIGLILAIVGSYQIYAPIQPNPLKLLSNIGYSVIKLFIFVPTYSMEKTGPLAYELAIWVAPISTVLGFLQIFSRSFYRVMLSIFHYRRTFFAVMGANVRSLAFLRNLQTENPKERFVCIVPEQADSQEFAKLEQRRIKVVALDYNNPDSYANQATLKSLRLRNAKAIVSFEDEPESFGHAAVFNDWLEQLDLRPIPFYLLTADNRLKELISPQVMTWQRLNTQFFNLAELQAIELMSRETFSLYRTKGLTEPWSTADVASRDAIIQRIGHAHLLLIGFGKKGRAVLTEASNIATINPDTPLEATIVDRNIDQLFDFFTGEIDELDKVVTVHRLKYDLQSKALISTLRSIQESSNPFTAIVFCTNDTQQSLLTLERLGPLFDRVPCAVYCRKPSELQPLFSALDYRKSPLLYFGNDSTLLTRDVILNDTLLRQAKRFNARYHMAAEKLNALDIVVEESAISQLPAPSVLIENTLWQQLTPLIKESSLAQALHRPVKRLFLQKLCELEQYPNTPEELVAKWAAELSTLPVRAQVDAIAGDPVKSFL